ncbi:HTH-type transcriptional regulator ImmR [Clostridium homopropionicum DSM 5847]|uniref:HTH-type transcriptional regulator ImmR n=1 Tax=Clostridium homopropionicum DSM 5847 TaxID=1121318 RepID=A0A0L6ZBI6_9CLOT|nr:helix-turn-helix transcriptional regulator [Clostridium homopropionicum]KOA20326.1 HTH-type transcriptional regulator ImmR [Clostridium homopropionicum DSM 5847]SFG93764.1 Transcriptional regulator, contains XRE-family HTH domain [Clostridium homopropionicum]
MNYRDLGQRIREERLKLNLTQEKLAESIDISSSYMGQIERGDRSVTLETLVKLVNKLGVTIDYLLQDYTNSNDDIFINQFKQLMYNRDSKQKQMALDVLKMMFSHVDKL